MAAILIANVIIKIDIVSSFAPNLPWLLPVIIAIIAIFITPLVTFNLYEADIHFYWHAESKEPDKIRFTLVNRGAVPFSFNRIQFVSVKNKVIFGKRIAQPSEGIYDTSIEYHGAISPFRVLHEHIGCTIIKGQPIDINIRDMNLKKYISLFNSKQNIFIRLYWDKTDEQILSPKIPMEILKRVMGRNN